MLQKLRIDFILRYFHQINEQIAIAFENTFPQIVSNPHSWAIDEKLDDGTEVQIFIHPFGEISDQSARAAINNAVRDSVLKEWNTIQNYDRDTETSILPFTQLDDDKNSFFEALQKGIESFQNTQLVMTNIDIDSSSYIENETLDKFTWTKLNVVRGLMLTIRSYPKFPPTDYGMQYRKLPLQIQRWIDSSPFPIYSSTPFTSDWVLIFNYGKRLPAPKSSKKFYGHLIHCLLIEIQLLINQQYFQGLGFPDFDVPFELLDEMFPDFGFFSQEQQLERIKSTDWKQLYSRNFIEYLGLTQLKGSSR